jgi:hypothetical protein
MITRRRTLQQYLATREQHEEETMPPAKRRRILRDKFKRLDCPMIAHILSFVKEPHLEMLENLYAL